MVGQGTPTDFVNESLDMNNTVSIFYTLHTHAIIVRCAQQELKLAFIGFK